MKSKYVIISPVRNEEIHVEKTLISVINQTVEPCEWIVVNDGSSDNTENIIRQYTEKFPWIKLVNKKDRGFIQIGKGVIEAFNFGYHNLSENDWKFIVKLDCDLSFDRDYFEKLFRAFEKNENLGISGGATYLIVKNKLKEEKVASFHPMAAARIYKRACFEEIGGLQETLGWDTIDLLRAHMKGWETKRFKSLQIIHYRKMGSRTGFWKGKKRTGNNIYITGYHPFFVLIRCIYRIKDKPYGLGALGIIYGYIKSWWRRDSLVLTLKEKKFLRRQQLRRLFGSKKLIWDKRSDRS